jgi:CubicO group peptidase (beta-lactamase class C family)
VGEDRLQLNDPESRWLPGFDSLQMQQGGVAERFPTLRKVMTHRAEFFSQEKKLTPEQSCLIRDFSLSSTEVVEGIAKESLRGQPGQGYACSGAGYFVSGRVAGSCRRKHDGGVAAVTTL